jgi:type IX secretion system PorP/SprF family membrane protein
MKKVVLALVLGIMPVILLAQDVQYSQFYAAPLYLNPAFAGAGENTRFGVNYRNQWPGMNQTFNSFSAYIDHYLFNINSGVGVMVNGSRESMTGSSSNEFGLLYSYRLQLGFRSFLRVGGHAAYVSRDADFGNLVFNSQINPLSGAIGDGSGEQLLGDLSNRYMDYNFGALFHNETHWLGFSAHHVTEPSSSFLEPGFSHWPLKLSLHGGMKFTVSEGISSYQGKGNTNQKEVVLAFNYKNQKPFSQLDLGMQFNVQPLVVGMWYRGIPSFNEAMPNNESIIMVLGMALTSGLDIGYSYDFTISRLGYGNTGGAHEVSMRYSFNQSQSKDKARKAVILPCFKY